jgi:S1-C subfamily serine protease
MKKRRIVFLATMAAALLMAFGGVAAQAAGSSPSAHAQQQVNQEPGLVIVSVDPSGPAATAGVKRGDILLEVDGQKTDRARDLLRMIGSFQPDDQIKVRVLHGDSERTLDLTVGERNGQPYLGLQPYFGGTGMVTPDVNSEAAKVVAPGALITEVVPDSPAADAGLEAGNVITAVDGKTIDETTDLATAIGQYKPGDKITLEVAKSTADEARSELTVTLGKNPDQADKALLGVRYRPALDSEQLDDQSMPSVPATPNGRQPRLGRLPFFQNDMPSTMPEAQAGAMVQSVTKDSPAESAGLQAGDVITGINGTAVASPQDLVDAVSAQKPGATVTLTVIRSGEKEPVSVKVTLGENPDKAGKAYLGVSIGAVMMMMDSSGQTPGGFKLPFNLDDLPFDLNKLPMPFDHPQVVPSGQEPA